MSIQKTETVWQTTDKSIKTRVNTFLAARAIVAKLTPSNILYAADKARGDSQGFAALNDLFDANELLAKVMPPPQSGEELAEWCDRANVVMDKVDELIISHPIAQLPLSAASAVSDVVTLKAPDTLPAQG